MTITDWHWYTRIIFIVLMEELKREFVHSNRKHKPCDTTFLRVLFYDPQGLIILKTTTTSTTKTQGKNSIAKMKSITSKA